jgi:hypothetical protein
MNPVVVVGGYGTFGALVCRELAARGVALTIAGRDLAKAEAFARQLGSGNDGIALDLRRPDSFRAVLKGRRVAVNCAGPFSLCDTKFLEACLSCSCHYADIADDRAYANLVRQSGVRFAAAGLAAVWGCSSLPGISGALAHQICGREKQRPKIVRATLFIGNNNPKGRAAVASLVQDLGRPIAAPQGMLRAGWDREFVSLPPPFGRRRVFNFDSPDYDLLDVPIITVKVGFELGLCTLGLSLLAHSGWRFGRRVSDLLATAGNWLKGIGCSGGAVLVEAFFPYGEIQRAAVVAPTDGQRMAALPCALVVKALLDGTSFRGAGTAYELLGADRLLNEMAAAGFAVWS